MSRRWRQILSTDTVSRDWKFAKTWLYLELRNERRRTR
jgi:hypothetical protein